MEKWVLYLGYFSISFEKITFYTEILPSKVDLWSFSLIPQLKSQMESDSAIVILDSEQNLY